MHTENLGIERVIKNVLANTRIRFLLLCGEDTQHAVGHLPGQSLESLFSNGIDDRGRIVGARGKRPVLKNVTPEEIASFLRQVELISMIGSEDVNAISAQIRSCVTRDPGRFPYAISQMPIERIHATEPARLILDKEGYFVVYPDRRSARLVMEHYTNQGVLNCVLEGTSTGALYSAVIERHLLSRLDHAAYLGRELARAEHSLLTGSPFVQDAAPGELAAPSSESCGVTGGSCCGAPTPAKSVRSSPSPGKKDCCL